MSRMGLWVTWLVGFRLALQTERLHAWSLEATPGLPGSIEQAGAIKQDAWVGKVPALTWRWEPEVLGEPCRGPGQRTPCSGVCYTCPLAVGLHLLDFPGFTSCI